MERSRRNIDRISIPGAELSVRTTGQGPPVLWVHGFPLDHTMWTGQLEALDHLQQIAPDLRGFGASTGLIDQTLTMAQLADDLAELLTELQIRQPITMCGLSMGGYIALEFWNRHPDRLEKLVLCDTRANSDTAETAKGRQLAALTVLAEGNASLAETMVPRLFVKATAIEQPETVENVRRVVLSTAPATVAAALRGMAVRTDFSSRLAKLEVPTLVVCGSDDVITPAKEMRRMAASIPNATYVEIPDAGHMAPLERPMLVNRAIESFLG
jgi:3-oxoadipate enol-lactonase